MSDLYNICNCGRRISVNRDICINCQNLLDGVEDEFEDPIEQFKADAKKIVDESVAIAKEQGYGKKDAVSPEECARRGREIDPVFAVMEAPYLSAVSYKWHDTRYRDADPDAFTSAETLIKKYGFLSSEDAAIFKNALADFGEEQRQKVLEGNYTFNYKPQPGPTYMGQELVDADIAEQLQEESNETIVVIQKYCDEDGKDNIRLNEMYKNMVSRSKRIANYDIINGRPVPSISTLAKTPSEAIGHNSAANGTSRGTAIVGHDTLRILPEDDRYLLALLKEAKKTMYKYSEGRKSSELDAERYEEAEELAYQTKLLIIEGINNSDIIVVEPAYATGTHYGTNPFTGESLATYNTIGTNVLMKVDGKINKTGQKNMEEFYEQFDMHKHNYVGTVNKKSDGRCSRTGDIGDPKSPLYMQQYRHTPSIIITPNTINTTTTRQVEVQYFDLDTKTRGSKMKKEITIVTRGNDCECGCNVKVKDMRRGEILCPQCGIVFGRAVGDDV